MPRLDALQDPSLRLAVVETLSRAGKLDLGAVPTATNQQRTNLRTLNALLRVEVPGRALAGITELWWEGGQRLQHLVWPQWHGEDDTLYVHTLAGIDALAGLKKLTLATDADLLPLLDLPARRVVSTTMSRFSGPREGEVPTYPVIHSVPTTRAAA